MNGDSFPAHESDQLIAHIGWIRALARHMVADAHHADDLAQETCVVALEERPRDVLSIKSWLKTIMRNLARQSGRSEHRRRAREAGAARAERIEGTADLVERASMQRQIVDAVLGLEEPYRSTILLRFFEDLPPREIARRLDLPVTTVQSRLKRGLQRLRERLDDLRGERRAWLALLAPLSATTKAELALTIGGVIVSTKMISAVISVAIVATVVGVAGLTGSHGDPIGPAQGVALGSSAAASPEIVSGAIETADLPAQRVELSAAEIPASSKVAPTALSETMRRVRGRVIDADANALGGVGLVFEAGQQKQATRSRAGGWFELETTAASGTLAASEKGFATVRNGHYQAGSTFEPVVIVAPAIEVGGTVLDPQRVPLQGARVSLALPKGFETRFGQVLELTRVLQWSELSDSAGRFTLRDLPQVAGSTLRVLVDGYEPASQPEPEFSDPNLCFVLQRPAVLASGALRGRVVDQDGRTVDRARVAAGLTSAVTDEKGEFALDLSRAVTAERVTAVKQGFRPASMERPDTAEGDSTGWPDFIELRVGGPSLSIRGQVVDPEGQPRGGMRVWIADPTPFGLIGKMPTQNENLMAGAIVPPRALEPDPNPPREDGDSEETNRNAGGPPTACWYWVVSGDDGRFELPGLDDRKYTLRVLDTKTLQIFTNDPIRAGDHDARIVMPAPPVYPKLAGRVITVGDRPVEGVRLSSRITGFETHMRYFGGKLNVLMMNAGEEKTTDAQGRFEFRDVPRTGVFFFLRSDDIVPTDWTVPADADPENLEVYVDVRCQLEVRLKAPVDRADAISVLDDQGEEVQLITMSQESISLNSSIPLEAGRSGVVSASSSAATLELRKNDKVVEQVSIRLVPDEITLIEP